MKRSPHRPRPRRDPSTRRRKRQQAPTQPQPRAEIEALTAQRTAFLASMSGGTLHMLSARIKAAIAADNGSEPCERLLSGDFECLCDYCELFWGKFEDLAPGPNGRRLSSRAVKPSE